MELPPLQMEASPETGGDGAVLAFLTWRVPEPRKPDWRVWGCAVPWPCIPSCSSSSSRWPNAVWGREKDGFFARPFIGRLDIDVFGRSGAFREPGP